MEKNSFVGRNKRAAIPEGTGGRWKKSEREGMHSGCKKQGFRKRKEGEGNQSLAGDKTSVGGDTKKETKAQPTKKSRQSSLEAGGRGDDLQIGRNGSGTPPLQIWRTAPRTLTGKRFKGSLGRGRANKVVSRKNLGRVVCSTTFLKASCKAPGKRGRVTETIKNNSQQGLNRKKGHNLTKTREGSGSRKRLIKCAVSSTAKEKEGSRCDDKGQKEEETSTPDGQELIGETPTALGKKGG